MSTIRPSAPSQGFLRRLASRMGGKVNKDANEPILREGPKAPLKPHGQIAAEDIIMGWRHPGRTVQPSLIGPGYTPQWRWVQPPGVGNAPQHIYDVYALVPVDNRGPGDNPVTFLRIGVEPVIQNFAMRMQGFAVDGGNFLMTGLYTPAPIVAPNQP